MKHCSVRCAPVLLLVAVCACTEISDVSSPVGTHQARITATPSYAYTASLDPINQIRLTARNRKTDEVVQSVIKDVSPTDDYWELSFEVTLDKPVHVVLSAELINQSAAGSIVQYSGVTQSFEIVPKHTSQPKLDLYPGPLENLQVKSIRVSAGSVLLDEGGTTQYTAAIDGPGNAVPIWISRDPSVVSVSSTGRATAFKSGSTYIVVAAGPTRDSVNVRVSRRIVIVLPSAISRTNGDEQSGTVDRELPAPIGVLVRDSANRPMAGVALEWKASSGSIISEAKQTETDGTATGRWRLGKTVGRQAVTVCVQGTQLCTTFNSTALADEPKRVQKRSGGGLKAVASPTLSDSLEIQLLDQFDNVVSNVRVEWTITNGSGKLGTQTTVVTTTDVAGVTRVAWTLGTKAGKHSLRARVVGTNTPIDIDFENEVQPGPLKKIKLNSRALSFDALNDTVDVNAQGSDEYDNLRTDILSMSASNPSVLNFANGKAVSKKNGTAKITIASGGVSDSVTVSIAQKPRFVSIQGKPDTLKKAQATKRLNSKQKDRKGNSIDDQSYMSSVTWSSDLPGIASVVQTGDSVLIIAKANGVAKITVVLNDNPGVRDSTYVIVEAGPQGNTSLQFSSWTTSSRGSAAPSVATFGTPNGLSTAVSAKRTSRTSFPIAVTATTNAF